MKTLGEVLAALACTEILRVACETSRWSIQDKVPTIEPYTLKEDIGERGERGENGSGARSLVSGDMEDPHSTLARRTQLCSRRAPPFFSIRALKVGL